MTPFQIRYDPRHPLFLPEFLLGVKTIARDDFSYFSLARELMNHLMIHVICLLTLG